MLLIFLQKAGNSGGGLLTAATLSVLAAAIAFIFNQFNEAFRRRHEQRRLARERDEQKRSRREALLLAFYGEVKTLENFLWMEAERNRLCLSHELHPEIRGFKAPNRIFQANASSLGELGDSRLVAGLVTLYSMAENVSADAAVIEALTERDPLREYRYLGNLGSCLGSAVNLHAWLRQVTKDYTTGLPDVISGSDFEAEHGDHLRTAEGLLRVKEELLHEIRAAASEGSEE
jgi:hypothetical protein